MSSSEQGSSLECSESVLIDVSESVDHPQTVEIKPDFDDFILI